MGKSLSRALARAEMAVEAMSSAMTAYQYADSVLGYRWCQAELLIMRDPLWALAYARR